METGLRKGECIALMRVRAQAAMVRRIRMQLTAQTCGMLAMHPERLHPQEEEMAAFNARHIRIKEMERIVRREEAELRTLQKRTSQIMEKLHPELYVFCKLYYYEGLSIREVAKTIDRTERQCRRYRSEVEDEGFRFDEEKRTE